MRSIYSLLLVGFIALSLSTTICCQSFSQLVKSPVAPGTSSIVVPAKVLAGRFDNDPYPDLFFFDGEESLALNDQGGGLRPATLLNAISNGNREGVAGDLNGDGLDDAVFISQNGNTLTVLLAAGNGSFSAPVSYPTLFPPSAVKLGDLDGDGDLDVAVNTSNRISFWLNLGSGNLSGTSSITNSQITGNSTATLGAFDFEDLDADGDADLVVYAQYFNPFPTLARNVHVQINSGGSFPGTGPSRAVGPVAHLQLEELDGNVGGGKEILVAGGNQVSSYRFVPFSGQLLLRDSYTASTTIRDLETADFDGDSRADVALSLLSGNQSRVEILRVTGLGIFNYFAVINADSPNVVVPTAVDLDRDGHADLVMPRASLQEYAVSYAISEAPDFRKLMISEVSWGNPDFVEITNHSLSSQSLLGWTVRWRDFGSTKTSTPLTETLAAGETLVVWEASSTSSVPGQQNNALPSVGTSSGSFVVALADASGTVVDEVRVSDTSGNNSQEPQGGAFRGLALRSSSSGTGSVERIWGLDSNSGSDWTEQAQASPGVENRGNGARGSDPIPRTPVKITELDAAPDYIELFIPTDADLQGWFFFCSPEQNEIHRIIRPWPNAYPVQASDYVVVGDVAAAPPTELPASAMYIGTDAVGGGNIPWTSNEFDCALYDSLGRLVDLVRVCGHDDACVHNFPRAPAAWDDFLGYAVRDNQGGEGSLCRLPSNADTDGGGDWYASLVRTMGSANAVSSGAVQGRSNAPDARIHDTAVQGGLALIINAGPTYAGHTMTLLFDFGHFEGEGPIFGLGPNALTYWNTYSVALVAPFGAVLDGNGSYRYDLPPGALAPGFTADHRVLIQDPTGALVAYTRVLEQDH